MNNIYTVLLYYKYIEIKNPNFEIKKHLEFLKSINLLGRVIISEEGINGSLCGEDEYCAKYIEYMNNHLIFNNIEFKKSESNFICFSKLHVKYKKEITILGIDPKDLSAKDSTKKISPKEFHEAIKNKKNNNKDFILFDIRNNYESRIGSFEGAIKPDLKNFRDFPKYFEENKDLFKDKEVYMYCTGGIRCERASALLNKINIAKDIIHLNGGIHKYVEEYPNGFFRGKNYVFDDRVSMKINNDILTSCDICNIECDSYNNCLNAICNKHYISCDACMISMKSCCSKECKNLTESKSVPLRPPLVSRFNINCKLQ